MKTFQVLVAAFVFAAVTPALGQRLVDCTEQAEAAIAQGELAEALDSEEASQAATGLPQTITAQCGQGTSLLETLPRGLIQVPLGRTTRAYYPLLLTDKPTWACVRVRISTACVLSQEATPEGRVIRLRTTPHPSRYSEERLLVKPDGSVVYPANARYFRLLPRVQTQPRAGTAAADYGRLALDAAAAVDCRGRNCKAQRNFVAERNMFKAVRIEQQRPRLPADTRRTDLASVVSRFSDVTGTRRAIFEMTLMNEVGGAIANATPSSSPLQIVDALEGSGPSFGAHQIDIGTNRDPGIAELWTSIAQRSAAGVQEPALNAALREPRSRFASILNDYNNQTLGLYWQGIPYIDRELRSPDSRDSVDRVFRHFLDTRFACFNAMRSRPGIFTESPFLALYVIDVSHQYGPGRALRFAQYIALKRAQGLSVAGVETAALAYLRSGAAPETNPRFRFKPRPADEIQRRSDSARSVAAEFSASSNPSRRFDAVGAPTACGVAGMGGLADLR